MSTLNKISVVVWTMVALFALVSSVGAQTVTLTPPTTSAVLNTLDLDRDGRVAQSDAAISVAAMLGYWPTSVGLGADYRTIVRSILAKPLTSSVMIGNGPIRARFVQSLSPTLRKFHLSADLSQMRAVLTADQQLDGLVFRSDAMTVDTAGNTKPANTIIMVDTLGDPNMGWPSVSVATTVDRIIAVCAKQIRDVRGNTISYVSPSRVSWDGSRAVAIDVPRASLAAPTTMVTTGDGRVVLANVNVPGAQTVRVYRRPSSTSVYTLVTEVAPGSTVTVNAPNNQPVLIGLAGVVGGAEGQIVEVTATPAPPPLPNLTIASARILATDLVEGQLVTLEVMVEGRNIGIVRAVQVEVLRADSGEPLATTSMFIPNLPGIVTQRVNLDFRVQGSRMNVTVLVDPNNAVAEANEGDNVFIVPPFSVRPAPRPNLRIASITLDPASPYLGQSVTMRVLSTYIDALSSVDVLTRIVRVETGVSLGTLLMAVNVGAGSVTQTFSFFAEENQSFRVTLDANREFVEVNEADNEQVVVVPTRPRAPSDDFKVEKRADGKWYAVFENIGRHFGEPLREPLVFRNSDAPSAIRWGTTGQKLSIIPPATAEWEIDTETLGDFRFGLRATSWGGQAMFVLPGSMAGSSFYKSVGSVTSSDRNFAYRVVSTPQGRVVTAVADAFVRTRPYVVGSDPGSVETTRPDYLTDLYIDPVRNRLYFESVTAHLVAPVTPVSTAVGLALVDPPPGNSFELILATTCPYDLTRDQMSVSLSGFTTESEHRINLGLRSGVQRVLVGMFSFGSRVNAASETVPTHSLLAPSATEPLIRLRWNQGARRWGTAR